jgi:UDPglucose 6-dehydrogenase
MLATKISFMNEISNLCERLGVDVENVRKGIGSDSRIGYSFIYPGCGYGGSCFPKDVKALVKTGRDADFTPTLLEAVEERNNLQKQVLGGKVINRFGLDLTGRTFGIWGLAFKPGTDDMREASSQVLIKILVNAGARVNVYDPVAMEQAKKEIPAQEQAKINFAQDQYSALDNTDACILVTEWKTFRQPDFKKMASLMKERVIFDGRNQYDPDEIKEAGFEYHGIGRELG